LGSTPPSGVAERIIAAEIAIVIGLLRPSLDRMTFDTTVKLSNRRLPESHLRQSRSGEARKTGRPGGCVLVTATFRLAFLISEPAAGPAHDDVP
jgi:hypothetical protein